MKKLLLFNITLFFLLCGTSCGDDDEEPTLTHEIGEWSLDSYALQNFPAGFESNEGLLLRVDQISLGGLSVESYKLVLNNDGTYTRSIDVTGPDVNDNGTWELDDDDLELEPEDGDFQEFSVARNENNDLWLVARNGITTAFIPDIYFDTVTQSYLDFLDTLSNDQIDSISNVLSEPVVADLVYIFERD
ncbi:MAG: hypothetical protein AAGC64_07365 [Bacteroidota bacterium]